MAQPRPSLTLILDLDERLDSEDVRLEIDRCYSYVGSTLVRTHPACDGEPQNIMRFLVKLGTRRYLRAEDEGADELWNDVMERGFYNELYKVSNNMLIYNRRQREVGNPSWCSSGSTWSCRTASCMRCCIATTSAASDPRPASF